jgi:integrase
VYLRGRLWWVKLFREGRPCYESSESEKRVDAERLLKRRNGEIVTGKFIGLGPERIEMAQLFADVIEDYETYKRRSTDDARARVTLHLDPALGNIRAAQLSSEDLKRYILRRRDEKAADATINRELAIIRRAFSLAAKSSPPKVNRVIQIPRLEEQNVRGGFLEHDHYLKLREALPEHLKAIFVVGYHLGMRIGELRNIWEQVGLEAGEIRLSQRQTKNKRPRTLPIYGEMAEWIAFQKQVRDQKRPDCPWVFSFRGRRIGAHMKGWRAACIAAGLSGLLFS